MKINFGSVGSPRKWRFFYTRTSNWPAPFGKKRNREFSIWNNWFLITVQYRPHRMTKNWVDWFDGPKAYIHPFYAWICYMGNNYKERDF